MINALEWRARICDPSRQSKIAKLVCDNITEWTNLINTANTEANLGPTKRSKSLKKVESIEESVKNLRDLTEKRKFVDN